MNRGLNIFGILLILAGVFGFFSESVAEFLVYLFSLPLVLPIFLGVIGFMIFLMQMDLSGGIFIDTEGKMDYEIDQELAQHMKERGYDVHKKM